MPKSIRHGFTLIELLVVIAIIGILASIVLVSLGNARDQANDARIKSDVSQLRVLAEVHKASNTANYAGFDDCIDTPNSTNCKGGIENSVTSLKIDLNNASGGTLEADASPTEFCISHRLKTNTGIHLCVDASGRFTETTDPNTCVGATTCP